MKTKELFKNLPECDKYTDYTIQLKPLLRGGRAVAQLVHQHT